MDFRKEIGVERLVVDFYFSLSRFEIYTGYRCFTSSNCIDTIHLSELDFLRLLCGMGMFCTGINMQAAVELIAKSVLGQHPPNSVFHEPLRALAPDHGRRMLALTTRIPRVRKDYPVCPLLAGHTHLGSVDYDHMIPAIHVRRVSGLMLSTDNASHTAGQTAQHLLVGIHNHPALLNLGLAELCRLVTVVIHSIILNVNTKTGHF